MTKATVKLITNDRFRKSLKTSCKVQMFDTVDVFNEFVAVGRVGESAELLFDADTLLLGQAWLAIGMAFKKSLEKLPKETQDMVITALSEAE